MNAHAQPKLMAKPANKPAMVRMLDYKYLANFRPSSEIAQNINNAANDDSLAARVTELERQLASLQNRTFAFAVAIRPQLENTEMEIQVGERVLINLPPSNGKVDSCRLFSNGTVETAEVDFDGFTDFSLGS